MAVYVRGGGVSGGKEGGGGNFGSQVGRGGEGWERRHEGARKYEMLGKREWEGGIGKTEEGMED